MLCIFVKIIFFYLYLYLHLLLLLNICVKNKIVAIICKSLFNWTKKSKNPIMGEWAPTKT